MFEKFIEYELHFSLSYNFYDKFFSQKNSVVYGDKKDYEKV